MNKLRTCNNLQIVDRIVVETDLLWVLAVFVHPLFLRKKGFQFWERTTWKLPFVQIARVILIETMFDIALTL
jgi:hypothetical protein